MDIVLARTFLEVIAAGNFVAAAKRLHVTQSAVSLRIRRLEDLLGKPVFLRAKTGTELTPAGRQFERFARSFLKVWEEARHQVTIPEGFRVDCTKLGRSLTPVDKPLRSKTSSMAFHAISNSNTMDAIASRTTEFNLSTRRRRRMR